MIYGDRAVINKCLCKNGMFHYPSYPLPRLIVAVYTDVEIRAEILSYSTKEHRYDYVAGACGRFMKKTKEQSTYSSTRLLK